MSKNATNWFTVSAAARERIRQEEHERNLKAIRDMTARHKAHNDRCAAASAGAPPVST